MSKVFRPSTRESSILSKIESSKEHARRQAITSVRDCIDPLSNAIAMKLVEDNLVETTSKNVVEEQIKLCLEKLVRSKILILTIRLRPLGILSPNRISSAFT